MRKKVVLIHFQPLEYYPPAQNMIRFFSSKNAIIELKVFSTVHKNYLSTFSVNNCSIIRFSGICGKDKFYIRWFKYFYFNLSCFLNLIFFKPDSVFYIETISAFSAVLYKKYINKSCNLLIHYHEYTSNQDYVNEMVLVRLFHEFEKKIFNDCIWISQTNEERLKQFVIDNPGNNFQHLAVIPNYPPRSWEINNQNKITNKIIQVVYAGSLSLDTMYTREFANWVVSKGGTIKWDIYSYNLKNEVVTFFESLSTTYIKLHEGVNYDILPEILQKYDIGIILYKGHSFNYIYNAPNKLFEYFAVGLDVWFPKEMIGSIPYIRYDAYPKILSIDFKNLDILELHQLTNKKDLLYSPSTFFCENVYIGLISYLNE